MKFSSNLDTFFFHLKPFLPIFQTLPIHANYLHQSTLSMIIQCFYCNFFIYLLLPFAYLCIAWYIAPFIPFSTIINILLFANNSNFNLHILNKLAMLIQVQIKKWAESSAYVLIHLFLKLSNTSAINNVSLWTYISWY